MLHKFVIKETSGVHLDALVAHAQGLDFVFVMQDGKLFCFCKHHGEQPSIYSPSTSWDQAHTITESNWAAIVEVLHKWLGHDWSHDLENDDAVMLMWLMRAFVVSKLGEVFELDLDTESRV